MAFGIDRRGRGTSNNYSLMGGTVEWCDLNSNDQPDENWKDLGCMPSLNINISSQNITHQCAKEGLLTTDATVVSQVEPTITGAVDEMKAETLALIGLGDADTLTQAAVADLAIGLWVPNPNYTGTDQIDKSIQARSYSLFTDGTNIEAGGSGATFTHNGATMIYATTNDTFDLVSMDINSVTFPFGQDGISYDSDKAIIYIDGSDLTSTAVQVAIDAEVAAAPADALPSSKYIVLPIIASGAIAEKTHDRIVFLSKPSKTIALRFFGINAKTDEKITAIMPKATLFPQGDINLISATGFASFQFNGSLEKNTNYLSSGKGFYEIIKAI